MKQHRSRFDNCWPIVGLMLVAGCDSSSRSIEPPPSTTAKKKVIAQGQILPAGGIIQLGAAPGDIVQEVLVEAGKQVEAGATLIRMRSESVRQAQRATLVGRRAQAKREQRNAIAQAQRQVSAAELNVAHLASQHESLQRQQDLLEFAKQQVDATHNVLKQLESIASDEVTREFVGEIEIDRQQVEVGEAELSYRQQVENHRRARDDWNWAKRAADEELAAAQALLKAAQENKAIKIIDLEMAALDEQIAAASIVAPTPGLVLAINATQGEASGHLPLIELADTRQLVCEVEINEMDAALVESGQSATIMSRAFGGEPLRGTVKHRYEMVGRPQLRPLDPLARIDFRAVTAVIELDENSSKIASKWLQLHVEVEIDTTKKN